jgi:hypothetical protein
MSASRRKPWLLGMAILLVIGVVGSALAWSPLIRPAMYSWTGERNGRELIKGTASYLYLQLTHPAPNLEPYTPMPYTDQPPFGVNTFLEQEVEPAKVARSLDMIRQAGFRFVRQEFPWEGIEISGKGDFWDHKWNVSAWAKYDRIVDMASERSLELIVRLDNPPAWSRADGDDRGTRAPPDRVEDYCDFVEAVVRRYRGKVRYYQIWNEPNIYPEWGEQPVDAAAYTRLLQEAYRRAKAADPGCVILSAALAQTVEQGPRDLSDLVYLQQMYDAGAKGYFDILAVMAYGIWTGPTDHRLGADRTNFSRPELIREIMVRNGDAGKPIWASEIGWNAIPKGHPDKPIFGRVTREQQARYAVEALERARREWPWMGVMNYWFFKRAGDGEKDQAFYYFSLLDPDFSPQPAFEALSEYCNAAPILYPGYHQETHWALAYSGGWQDAADAASVLGSYRRGGPGDELRFAFWGSELDVVCFGQASPSSLRATVDGRPARISATEAQGRPALALVRSAAPGMHTVELRVRDGGDGLAIDGLIVRLSDRRGAYALAGLGSVVAAVAAGWFIRRRWLLGPGTRSKGSEP